MFVMRCRCLLLIIVFHFLTSPIFYISYNVCKEIRNNIYLAFKLLYKTRCLYYCVTRDPCVRRQSKLLAIDNTPCHPHPPPPPPPKKKKKKEKKRKEKWAAQEQKWLQHTWWRHKMETFSALLAFCAGNSPVTGEFPSHRPVTRSFDVFFYRHLNKRLGKQSWGWWFETPPCSLWRHCNAFHRQNIKHSGNIYVNRACLTKTVCVAFIVPTQRKPLQRKWRKGFETLWKVYVRRKRILRRWMQQNGWMLQ